MTQPFRSDNDIIAEIRDKYNYHLSWANKYKAMLDAADGVGLISRAVNTSTTVVNIKGDIAPLSNTTKKKETFADVIVKYFADGKPKTTMMILALYNSDTSHQLDRKNLSSRLSIMAKLTKQIRNIEFDEASNDTRFWWGLSDWFDQNGLKEEYSRHVNITKKSNFTLINKSSKLLSLDDLK